MNMIRHDLARWWFDSAIQREAPFDVIGISYFPYWHGTLADLQNYLNDIAVRYDKDIVVVETAYPFTADQNDGFQNIIRFQTKRGYPATPEGQTQMMADVMTIARAVPNGHGLGEPGAVRLPEPRPAGDEFVRPAVKPPGRGTQMKNPPCGGF